MAATEAAATVDGRVKIYRALRLCCEGYSAQRRKSRREEIRVRASTDKVLALFPCNFQLPEEVLTASQATGLPKGTAPS